MIARESTEKKYSELKSRVEFMTIMGFMVMVREDNILHLNILQLSILRSSVHGNQVWA